MEVAGPKLNLSKKVIIAVGKREPPGHSLASQEARHFQVPSGDKIGPSSSALKAGDAAVGVEGGPSCAKLRPGVVRNDYI